MNYNRLYYHAMIDAFVVAAAAWNCCLHRLAWLLALLFGSCVWSIELTVIAILQEVRK